MPRGRARWPLPRRRDHALRALARRRAGTAPGARAALRAVVQRPAVPAQCRAAAAARWRRPPSSCATMSGAASRSSVSSARVLPRRLRASAADPRLRRRCGHPPRPPGNAPPAARLQAADAPPALVPDGLGIALGARGRPAAGPVVCGAGLDSVWVSVAQPGRSRKVRPRYRSRPHAGSDRGRGAEPTWSPLTSSAYELGFALGTEHPRLGWSARVREGLRDPRLPGPDGY